MRAVRIHSTGGPEVLQLEEAPAPEPGRNELLIRLRAAAVCRADLLLREGVIPLGKSMPHILGMDGAGAVVRGSGGDARPGDRVFVSGDVLGRLRDGTYAEFIVVPTSLAFPMPRDMRYEDAAALGMTAYTAWQALVDRAAIEPGQWVVIHAAGSGVGVAAIQIAKLLGARVIATAGADAKLEQARQLGADHGINYTKANFASQVRHMTNNRGVDVMVDTVGGDRLPSQPGVSCHGRASDLRRHDRRIGGRRRPAVPGVARHQCDRTKRKRPAALPGRLTASGSSVTWWRTSGCTP